MLTTISDAYAISKAQRQFEDIVAKSATKSEILTLGYQGGGRKVPVHLVADLDLWVGCADSGNRYWNALGTGNPFVDSHPIVAEINPPKSGINRRVSGAFLRDANGRTLLAHRGGIGGGRKGIGKKAFMSWYPEATKRVRDGDTLAEMIVIGFLDDSNFMENLAKFTRLVARFKSKAVGGKHSKGCLNR